MCFMADNQTSCQQHQHILSMQHNHWSNGDHRAPLSVHIIVGLFITTVGLVALVGNVLVIITCVRYKDLRTRSNILIINLAVGDLLMCIIDFPLLAIASFLQGWPFGFAVCRLYAFLTAVAGLVTINTLGVISADRYWAVVWRTSPRQQLPKYVTGLIVLGVWLYAISWAICPLLGWGDYVLDGIGTTCTFDYLTRTWTNRSFVIAMVFGNFVLPFVMMLFSYIQIWIAVCDVKRGLQEHQGCVVAGQRKKSVTRQQSVTSEAISDTGSNRILYKMSDGRDKMTNLPSKSQTFVHEFSSDKNQTGDNKEIDVGNQVSVSVSPLSSNDKNFIIFNFRKHNSDISEKMSISRLIKVPKKSLYQEPKQCQRYSFQGREYSTQNINHSKDNGLTRHKYYFVRSPKSPANKTSFTFPSKTYNDSDRTNAKVSLSSFHKVTSDKLFLKQHRYRLHCEYKTIKVIMYLLVAFIISWFPYVVVSMMGLFGDASRITYLSSVFPSLIAKSSMVFNPVLYSISHPKVRKRILHLFLCYSRLHNNNNNGVDGGTSGLKHGNVHFSSCSYSK